MSRLPIPGSDNGTWGDILNDYLSQAHASDGSLKAGAVGANHVQDGVLPKTKLDSSVQASLAKADGAVQSARFFVNLGDYGPAKDGVTDDSSKLQAAINDAYAKVSDTWAPLASAIVYVPYGYYRVHAITVPSSVRIMCDGARFTPPNSAAASNPGPMITFTGRYGGLFNAFLGGNHLVGCSAILLATGSGRNVISSCQIDNWDGRAVYDQGAANWMEKIFAQNCLRGADSLSSYTGVLELAGTDSWVMDCELTASRYPTYGMSASAMACALAINGANNMIQNVIAETSDHGVYIGPSATQTNMVGVRGELCYGHGWIINGGTGRITNPMALRNSLAGNYLYNGFHVPSTATPRFVIVNAWAESYTSPQPQQNWGFYDSNFSASVFNRWVNPFDNGSANSYFSTNNSGTTFAFPDNAPLTLQTNSSTPSVSGALTFDAANTSPITVTNFNKGVNGQKILIKGDGFTSVANGATITTKSGATTLLAAGVWYQFVRGNGVWSQVF